MKLLSCEIAAPIWWLSSWEKASTEMRWWFAALQAVCSTVMVFSLRNRWIGVCDFIWLYICIIYVCACVCVQVYVCVYLYVCVCVNVRSTLKEVTNVYSHLSHLTKDLPMMLMFATILRKQCKVYPLHIYDHISAWWRLMTDPHEKYTGYHVIVSGWGSGGHPEYAHAHVGCLIKYIMDQKNRYRNYTIYIYNVCVWKCFMPLIIQM